ncbi:MAG TPA: Ppx/GppA phosphatase family protein [Actinomycetota bacterium]|nr:Ppx/GppA phosphatase family protein [Actinomycetota bacterium]
MCAHEMLLEPAPGDELPAVAPTPVPADVVAAIDIGTNSLHLVIARLLGQRAFEVIEREKEMVRLGSGAGDMTHLEAGAIDRAIAVLARFREVAEMHGARVVAVATSAVREARNRAEFLSRALSEAGVLVEVVSGTEEARLIHLGVLQAVPVFDQRLLLCDIGGGSTELLLGYQGESLAARSMKLGAIRLTQRFFSAERATSAAVDSCRRFVRSTLSSFRREVERYGFDVAVGSSGSIGAVCAMASARHDETVPKTWNSFTLGRGDLDAVVKALVKAPTVEARAKLSGMDPRRADIILAGALILEQVFEEFGLREMRFSDYALREGVLLDAWRRAHGGSLHHLSDLRRRSVTALSEIMDEDREHSAHVAYLALDLFDQTEPLHRLGDDAREYLEAAALLCNIGLFVSHAAHHRHTYYLIRNSDHLTGFTDREIELIAQIARYHRKGLPRPTHPEFASLSKGDQRLVRCCAGLLRVAIGLDRTHNQRVTGVAVEAGEGTLRIEVRARPGTDPGLEIFSAAQRTDLLAEGLDRTVDIVAGPGVGPAEDREDA